MQFHQRTIMNRYKKVYIEITNSCNLSCPFCAKSKRKKEFITTDKFKVILDKLNGYTDYLYLHILGEPLLHPNINELIDLASNNYKVNITTNGYLINKIRNNKNIRQLNISLHSFSEKYNKTIDEYLDDIFESVDTLKMGTFISYRLWRESSYSKYIVDCINKKYNSNLDYNNIKNNTTIANNIFISIHEEFTWPANENSVKSDKGTCYALKDHIGILVDGRVVPCCLDSEGNITLGNIYKDTIEDIIKSERYQSMLTGFQNNNKCEDLCKKCNFINKKQV